MLERLCVFNLIPKSWTFKMEIRIATKVDAGYIALLGRITFTETFGHYFSNKLDLTTYLDSTFSVEKIESSFLKPNNIYWIAFVDRLAVGFAKLKLNSQFEFIESNDVCQLQKIYVLKDFLSLKIGFKMQSMLLKKAQEEGFETIWLSVLNSNQRAINFYTKNEFKSIGHHNFTIGQEDFKFIAMSKQLK
jgi:ribosomal protein S18 acetylase RimI-like enzyme